MAASSFNFLNPLQNIDVRLTGEQLSIIIEFFNKRARPLLVISKPDDEEEERVKVVTIDQMERFLNMRKFHRRSYHYPNYSELMIEAEKLGNCGITRMLTMDQFIYLLDIWVLDPDIKHELKLAFQVFDTEGRGFLEIAELHQVVTGIGDDPFTDEESRELLRDGNFYGDGNVHYVHFIDALFCKAPELNQLSDRLNYLYDNADEDPTVTPVPEPEVPELVAPLTAPDSDPVDVPREETEAAPDAEPGLESTPEYGPQATTEAGPKIEMLSTSEPAKPAELAEPAQSAEPAQPAEPAQLET